MKIKGILLLFMYVLATACEEAIDLPLHSNDLDILVVEGILTNEKINHRIRLSHPYISQNKKSVPASGALVRITNGADSVSLIEFPTGSGEYYTPKVRAVFGETYTLLIRYRGKEYFAKDSSVPVEPMQALEYSNVEGLYTLNFNETGQNPYFIDHTITWKNTVSCTTGSTCEGRIVFYDLKTIDVNESFKPEKARFNFPVNSIVVRKKYSVSAAYQTFLRSVLSETEWRGGVFDVQRANTTTNLSNGAIGFFAISTVVSDTTIVIKKP